MVKRKSSLAEAVHGASRTTAAQRPAGTDRRRVVVPPNPGSRPRAKAGGTKGLLLRLPPDLHRELRLRAVHEDTSLQALGVEALEMLLASRSGP